MSADLQPVAKCVCGHEKNRHHGEGPCIAGYGTEKRKALASVCPCTKFEETK